MSPSNAPRSYAEMVREDAEATPVEKPCTLFYYESTGLETDPIRAICECIVDKDMKKGGINEDDRLRLTSFFSNYRDAHAEDAEVQAINPEDIDAIAKFILNYDGIHSSFMDLRMKSNDDEVLDMDKVAEGGIYAIVQFMRSRAQGSMQQ